MADPILMRAELARHGLAVVAVDALRIAESCMQTVDGLDEIDGHPDGCTGRFEFTAAYKAIQRAIEEHDAARKGRNHG